MQFIPILFPSPKFISEPGDLVGWLGWILLLAFILWLTNRWKDRAFERIPGRSRLFVFLLLFIPLTSLFFGVQFHGDSISSAGPFQAGIFLAMAAVPWFLAEGLIGILPAMVLAGFSGLLAALFQTHSLFTPLVLILTALIIGYFLHQNFRTAFFASLRHPLASAAFTVLLLFPLAILFSFFSTPGSLANRLDQSLTQSWQIYLIASAQIILAGAVAEFIYHRKREIWYSPAELVPSPVEKSLKLQFLIATVPFLIAILVSLSIAIWVMAKNVSMQIIRDDLLNEADFLTGEISGLIETGQHAINGIASTDLLGSSPDDFSKRIKRNENAASFFSEVILLDDAGMVIAAYPGGEDHPIDLTGEESEDIGRVLNGLPPFVTVAPRRDGDVQVTFSHAIQDENGAIKGVILGRTQFALNQDKEKLFASMNTFERGTGNILLINGSGEVLEDLNPAFRIANYEKWSQDGTGFFEWVSPGRTSSLNYFQPIQNSDWSLILNVPYGSINQRTFGIAFPPLFIVTILISAAILGMLISLNRVSASLKTLNTETNRIAKGDLSTASAARGVDEVGKLGQSFEEMRTNLRSRLEELNKLVLVSKGVASSLDIEKSLEGVLKAAVGTRASTARIVLIPEVTLKTYPDGFFTMKAGTLTDVYSYFDRPLFEFMRHQELLALPKPSRMRRLDIPEDRPTPSSLIARALHHEDRYYGVLWMGYEQSREFTEEEIQFVNMLGDQTSLAASNASLFSSTEIARQRFEAVLASAPEPILVFDEKESLLMMNPAARDLEGLVSDTSRGNTLEETFSSRELINLVRRQEGFDSIQQEISLRNRKVFQVDVSPVYAQGSMIGKICTLREITTFKKLDSQKNEFVETVSHDLRSPLSMVKGYATMLPMLGEMNEQQQEYLKKINVGLDGMAHLVNNLLDLGRIESGEGIKLESIDPAPIIERVIKTLLPDANHKSIILEAALPEEKGERIRADATLLQQALYNLVENAIHFTNFGGRVDVGYRNESDKVVFFVKDNGIGISPIDIPGLFNSQPSGLVERAKAEGAGGGVKLGLKIVKTIVEKHGGSVRVESQLGKGSTFFCELPKPGSEAQG